MLNRHLAKVVLSVVERKTFCSDLKQTNKQTKKHKVALHFPEKEIKDMSQQLSSVRNVLKEGTDGF